MKIELTYFAVDGNYGEAREMAVLNTAKWTGKDWQRIHEASDSERVKVAVELDKKYFPVSQACFLVLDRQLVTFFPDKSIK